ncbi:hypothetical protein HNQ91_002068 [Filimonas zeae]|uniref:YD repeat-containing protein n=1 Tax=Filimonas zeae TaxID=1737353 RepID=A0A917IYI9_9BACT|nr:hypothetical protein [Filimonas zeae]MDR6339017.1 hypothetical protein [Filimonas zeae]GGH65498.1 hypothetical protein GCM10011379_18700 [Filimonas zeae]
MNKFIVLMINALALVGFRSYAQVDIQTGSSVWSVPVYSHSDPKSGLSHAVSLDYSSGQGIKTNQVASNVGLGWSLSAAGQVVRMVNGLPDDQYNPEPEVDGMDDYTASHNIYGQTNAGLLAKYYPNGYLYKKYDINYLPLQQAFQARFKQGEHFDYMIAPKAAEDTEQDMFMVNLNGASKTFVIGRDFTVRYTDGSFLQTHIIKEEKTDRGLYNQNIQTKILGFVITDEHGVEYTFNKYELEELHEVTDVGRFSNVNKRHKPTGKYVINKWVLTSIREPFSQREIQFEYETQHWEYVTDIILNRVGEPMRGEKPETQLVRGISSLICNASTYTQVLSAVVYPDNVRVQLHYNPVLRADISGAAAVSGIEVFSGSTRLRRLTLDMGYFSGKEVLDAAVVPAQSLDAIKTAGYYYRDDVLDIYRYRLALLKVHVIDTYGVDEELHEFEYYTGAESADAGVCVPGRLSFRRDFSGLYNKSMDIAVSQQWGTTLFPVNYNGRHFDDTEEAKCGLLKSARNPLRGTTVYKYRTDYLATIPRNAVLVDEVRLLDLDGREAQAKAYGYPYPVASSGFSRTVYNTNLGPSVNTSLIGRTYHLVYNKDGDRPFVGRYILYMAPSPAAATLQSLTSRIITEALTPYLGSIGGQLAGQLIANVLGGIIDSLFGSDTAEFELISTGPNVIWDYNPLPVLMSEVTEYEIVNGTKYAATAYRYKSSLDVWMESYDINKFPIEKYDYPYSGKQMVEPERLGHLISVTKLDRAGEVIYEKKYDYNYQKEVLDNSFKSVKYGATRYYSGAFNMSPQPYDNGTINSSWMVADAYNCMVGHNFMVDESERYLKLPDGRNSEPARVHHTYNSSNNLPKRSYRINSDGKWNGSSMFYASDYWDTYTGNTILQQMKGSNMLRRTVAVLTWTRASATAPVFLVTGVTLTEYDAVTMRESVVKTYPLTAPLQITEEQLDEFDAFTLPAWLTGSGIAASVDSRKVYKNFMLSETWTRNNTSCVTIKYDAETLLPAAAVENATDAEVAYTSFEHSDKDGWQYNNTGITTGGLMGFFAFNLQTGTLKKTELNASKTFRVTLWSTDNSTLVNGVAGTTLFSRPGWVLLQYMVTGQTQVVISGTATIDEVRLLPANARMKTFDYDGGTRKQRAENDMNNRVAYFEYDGWQRLIVARDENKDIIKRYCYTAAGKESACKEPGEYVSAKCEHVYAKLTYENHSYSNGRTYADIVVRFYADQARQQPCAVRDLTISWTNRNGCLTVPSLFGGSRTVSGWSVVLGKRVFVGQSTGTCPTCPSVYCDNQYLLQAGAGYDVVY